MPEAATAGWSLFFYLRLNLTATANRVDMKIAMKIVGGADWEAKVRALAAALSPAQLARLWQMLLKGLEDASRAPDPIAAAEMTIVRLCAAAGLPPPEDAARLLAAPSGPPASSRPPTTESRQDAGAPGGPVINSFEDVVQLIADNRDIDLEIAVERYIRLTSFNEQTEAGLRRAMQSLRQQGI